MEEDSIKPKAKKLVFSKLMNVYTISILIFIIWIALIDKNNIFERRKICNTISVLQKEKSYYLQKIEQDNRKKKELLSSRDNLEKFAREQYLMKKANEDIFIIVDE